jgi:hypothetical protein
MTKLSEQALELKRAYQREWREKNRESIRQYNRDYRRKNKERTKEAEIRYWNKRAVEQAVE